MHLIIGRADTPARDRITFSDWRSSTLAAQVSADMGGSSTSAWLLQMRTELAFLRRECLRAIQLVERPAWVTVVLSPSVP